MSGKQQDAKLDMALSEVIKKVPKGQDKKKRKSVEGAVVPGQAAKGGDNKAKKNKNKPKNEGANRNSVASAAANKVKKATRGGAPQPASSPAKPRRKRTGSANKQTGQNGFQVTILKDGGTTATGRLRAAKAARPSSTQQQQQQTKKGRRTSAGLQVTPAIKKKNNQQPSRKAKAPTNKGRSKKGGSGATGGSVTLNQRFSELKNSRT